MTQQVTIFPGEPTQWLVHSRSKLTNLRFDLISGAEDVSTRRQKRLDLVGQIFQRHSVAVIANRTPSKRQLPELAETRRTNVELRPTKNEAVVKWHAGKPNET